MLRYRSIHCYLNGSIRVPLVPVTAPLAWSSWRCCRSSVPKSFARSLRMSRAGRLAWRCRRSASCSRRCSSSWCSRFLECLQEIGIVEISRSAQVECCKHIMWCKLSEGQMFKGWLFGCLCWFMIYCRYCMYFNPMIIYWFCTFFINNNIYIQSVTFEKNISPL